MTTSALRTIAPTGPGPVAPTFSEVYAAHFRYVWRVLSRCGVGPADLEDLVQDVFVVVHRRLATFDSSRPIRPWLGGIAFRVASTYRRRARHRYEELRETQVEQPASSMSPEQAVAIKEQFRRVRTALATLDLNKRIVFVMHDMEQLSGPDVAAALEIPLNTVYSRLRRARAAFEAALLRIGRQEGEV